MCRFGQLSPMHWAASGAQTAYSSCTVLRTVMHRQLQQPATGLAGSRAVACTDASASETTGRTLSFCCACLSGSYTCSACMIGALVCVQDTTCIQLWPTAPCT